MPAATCKDDLIAVTETEFAKLQAVLGKVSPERADLVDDEGGSPKDIVAHRAHWIELFLGWYRDGQAGREVHFPAPGYKWNQLKEYNAALRAKQAGLTWTEACALLGEYHAELLALLQVLDENALYGGPMKGARNDWTTGRWAEAAGASHYRSAAKVIRGMLRASV